MFYKIRDLLPKAINKFGLKGQAQAALVVETAKKVVLEVWGETLSLKIKPKIFKNNTLYLEVLGSGFASDVNLERQKLISLVNKKIGQNLVKKIILKTK